MKKHYDVVIAGSGLGGLVSAVILAKEGYRVCVLEKNKQYGGNLQTFSRDKTIFDTGVHYIGGLAKGQNLYQYFNYLGIMENLQLKRLDENAFDIISFEGKPNYYHAQGFDNFVAKLSQQFPEEKEAIQTYIDKVRQISNDFPLYEVKLSQPYDFSDKTFTLKAKDYIDSLTDNEMLKMVLGGTNLLYAGQPDKTPFYVHALSVNSYIQSSYRCVKGGSQITKLLVRELKRLGGETYKKQEVVNFKISNKKIQSVVTQDNSEISGDLFISNIEPKQTLKLAGEEHFRKAYVKRIKDIRSTISAFSIYLVLKPKTIKYKNYNLYHYKTTHDVWNAQDYKPESWPRGYMVSMGLKDKTEEWADNMAVMTYMNYDEVKQWENTFNTTSNKQDRGEAYQKFKEDRAKRLLEDVEKQIPELKNSVKKMYASTPLSYRDYIGSNRGSMYGYEKDANNPVKSFISPKTKIKNLYLTGQGLNMHGILGVTISGVITCSSILGKDYLLKKIIKANTPN